MRNIIQYPHSEFVGCTQCQLLHPVVPQPGLLTDESHAAASEAYQEFVIAHVAHRTIALHRHGLSTSSSGPFWDPLASLAFEVTDGSCSYVVTASRSSIDEPRLYHFVAGVLAAAEPTIEIEDSSLRRGLDLELFPYAIRPSKVESFVGVLHDVISQIEADELEIAFDDADDPAVSIARMPDWTYDELRTRCAAIFDAWELPRVNSFLAANRDEAGLLALRVRQEYRVQSDAAQRH